MFFSSDGHDHRLCIFEDDPEGNDVAGADDDDDKGNIVAKVDDGGQYDCEIEADGDLPISVSHRLDILLPPRVSLVIVIKYHLHHQAS